ncbi:uncharacterized protein [Chelonus insularis]|uniref:uncharacterized protein n=1 Tax=Chelonus insularis TaxID=460826 RepID=UPI0015892801|nr:uncharacterized protein LOC118067479 [Chelonus insularis]
MENLTNLIIKTVLYTDHWCESINRRHHRQELRNLNDKKFWKTSKAKECRLRRSELRRKNDKFFMKTYWHLDNFFNGFKLVKDDLKQPIVSKSKRREVQKNGRYLAYLLALNKNLRQKIHEKYIDGIFMRRFRRRILVEENNFVNWDDDDADNHIGENIFNLQELFEGCPPFLDYGLVLHLQRVHKRIEAQAIWGPLTKAENVLNLRELFGNYDPELLEDNM